MSYPLRPLRHTRKDHVVVTFRTKQLSRIPFGVNFVQLESLAREEVERLMRQVAKSSDSLRQSQDELLAAQVSFGCHKFTTPCPRVGC